MNLLKKSIMLLVATAIIGVSGCTPEAREAINLLNSDANLTVSGLQGIADVGLIRGEPDAGYTISFNVKNEGERGLGEVQIVLSSSEGEWSRTQKLTLTPGESRRLSYFFHEPTINATNIEYRVAAKP